MNPQTLQTLLDEKADLAAISAHLDGISHEARLAETRTLGRAAQRKLWNLAPTTGIDLTHFVPESTGARTAVRHFGRNTLPVPGCEVPEFIQFGAVSEGVYCSWYVWPTTEGIRTTKS